MGLQGLEASAVVAGRYCVQATLGSGGMAHVYRVFDERTKQEVALKQLRLEQVRARPAIEAMFEREYLTLRQLAHPNIIQVYDYGRDESGAYYTMELLGGEDLHAIAPLPFEQACAVVRDVGLSLAILHSRRLLHRDVSPRNVRLDGNQRAKLLDFGAMATMGVARHIIGTPPCIPPEAVDRQALDARADLYALGALAYWTLTGRYAYASPTVMGLRDAWRSRPHPPSVFAPDVPKALDQLVMSLLSLDAMARPVSAGEVIERLTAIAALEPVDTTEMAQAYLQTPTMVGRDAQLLPLRKLVLRSGRGRGGSVLLQAPPGFGRTRMLQALELETRLAGAHGIAVECGVASAEYAVVRELSVQLLELFSEEAVESARTLAAPLLQVVPELCDALALSNPPQDAPVDASGVDEAFCRWVLSLVQRRALVVVIDDAHLADPKSISAIAQLARRAERERLAVVLSLPTGIEPRAAAAVSLFQQRATSVELPSLTAQDVQSLAGALFGDVQHVNAVGDWLARLCEGSPRTCMELAQHLVDNGIARYDRGVWLLPESLRENELPDSLEDALGRRIGGLSGAALELVCGLALAENPLNLDEYSPLLGADDGNAEVSRAVDEVVVAGLLVADQGTYAFAHRGLQDAARRQCPQDLSSRLHRRLASIFARRNESICEACHLLEAGDEVEALKALLRWVHFYRNLDPYAAVTPSRSRSQGRLTDNVARAIRLHEELLEVCVRLDRPESERHLLRTSLNVTASFHDYSKMHYVAAQIDRMCTDTGAIYMEEFAGISDAHERAKRCVVKAQEVYGAASEHERVFAPQDAFGQLVVAIAHGYMLGEQSLDLVLLANTRRLSDFFAAVTPQAITVARGTLHSEELVRGRLLKAAEVRAKMLATYETALRAENPHLLTRWGHGLQTAAEAQYRALHGGKAAEPWIELLAQIDIGDPDIWRRRIWSTRRLMHLYNGNVSDAAHCREELDQLAARHVYAPYGNGTAFLEARALAMAGDLLGLKQAIEVLARIVDRQYPRWRWFLDTARALYAGLCGDASAALELVDGVLSEIGAAEHAAWSTAAACRIDALVDLDRAADAVTYGREARDACLQAQLGAFAELELSRALALAEAAQGEHRSASERLEAALEQARDHGMEGLHQGVLHEARARVAIHGGSQENFERFAALTAENYRAGQSPALLARYERLVHEARTVDLDSSVAPLHAHDAAALSAAAGRHAGMTALEPMGGEERRRQALSLLLEATKTVEGVLYGVDGSGTLSLFACEGAEPPADLETTLQEYVKAEVDECDDVTRTCFDGDSEQDPSRSEVEAYRPVVLVTSDHGKRAVVGIAALHCGGDDPFRHPEWTLLEAVGRLLQEDSEREVVSMFGL